MRCEKCGAEINDNETYCPNCGNPTGKMPDYASLEGVLASGVSDILQESLDEDDFKGYEADAVAAAKEEALKKEMQNREARKKEIDNMRRIQNARVEKRKKRARRIITALVAAIIVLVLVVSALVFTSNSYTYQMARGNSSFRNEQYDKAATFYKKAVQIDPTSADPIEALGRVSMEKNDYSGAIEYFKKAIKVEPDMAKAYLGLCQSYEETGDLDKITQLLEPVKDKDKIIKACKDYYVAVPEFETESTTFDDVTQIKINSAKGAKIYYTTDGSEPNENSIPYEDYINLNEEGLYSIRAIAINDKGIKSESHKEEYKVEFPTVNSPYVTPATGTYMDLITIDVIIPDGCTVYYTLDGTTPDTNSFVYSGPIELDDDFVYAHGLDSSNVMFTAIAVNNDSGRTSSAIKRVYELFYVD